MYNTNFHVKYYDIKKELIWNIESKSQAESKYNNTDILLICDKLYRDELCSVFYADNIIDDKIEIGIKYVLEKLRLNNDFNQFSHEMKNNFATTNVKDSLLEDEKDYFAQNYDLIFILTLFKEESFYIFHKCICQQLTLGTIDSNLLEELKTCIILYFKTNNIIS